MRPLDGQREPGTLDERAKEAGEPRFDPLDSSCRATAQLAAPLNVASSQLSACTGAERFGRAFRSIEELLPQLVRRLAWSGDRRTVQLELGAGPHAGTTVTLHADGGRVRVDLQGSGADALRDRIQARLERQGIAIES